MSFTNTIKSEMDKKFKKMLDTTSEAPFSATPEISSQATYSGKRDKYYGRLNKEKSDFNNALQQVKNNRDRRLRNEQDRATAKARRRYNTWKGWKTVIFLLPLIFCALIGYDVFNPQGQMIKIETMESFSVGWAIALYVIFCIISVICSITFIVKMHQNEYFRSGIKTYNVLASLVLVFCIGLATTNLYFVAQSSNSYKVTFWGGDNSQIEYIEKGDSITLPSSTKADVDHDTYVTKYTFDGWLIDGDLYKAGQKYEPIANTSIEAKFTVTDWATVTIYRSNASITLSYDGKSTSPSNGDKIEIKVGTSITVTASFSYSDTSFSVGGSSVKSPYTFTLSRHTSINASSSDPGCLAEGTLITLYDGIKKAVEDLTMGDVLAVFNHETGKYEAAPLLANIHVGESAEWYNVINLCFSDGTTLRIVDEHGLFDKNLNKYVYIRENNVKEFIGHTFVATDVVEGEITSRIVILSSAYVTNEYIKIYNPASIWHINVIANDMLTLSAGMVNLFDYDESMQYNLTAMEKDIEKYGLYTYEDFKDYVSIEVYEIFPFKYYKVAVGKGLFSFEQILGLINLYYDINSVR